MTDPHRARASEDGPRPGPGPRVAADRQRPAAIRGRVEDPAGRAVPGALVALAAASAEVADLAAVAGPGGEFELGALPAGEYVLQADAAGQRGQRAITVGPDLSPEIVITLEPDPD